MDKLNHDLSLFTTIVIDTGNHILNPILLKAPRNGAVVWLVYNNDNTAHTVTIDPGSFKIKDTSTKVNPFVENKPVGVTVKAGQLGHLVAVIKSDVAYQTYKYTITSDGTPLDPDLEVVDP
jgi:hypothetical protein